MKLFFEVVEAAWAFGDWERDAGVWRGPVELADGGQGSEYKLGEDELSRG